MKKLNDSLLVNDDMAANFITQWLVIKIGIAIKGETALNDKEVLPLVYHDVIKILAAISYFFAILRMIGVGFLEKHFSSLINNTKDTRTLQLSVSIIHEEILALKIRQHE